MCNESSKAFRRAADAIREADALVIGAGAGMGVDSGLPDFRGNDGFWRAYPPYARLGLGFTAMANPARFREDPRIGWGFYGHRLNLYRETNPHEGFSILRRWAESKPHGGFVFTSNVDGHFQRAGFAPERIIEVHGAIDWLQCFGNCGQPPFSADGISVTIDPTTMKAEGDLPTCPRCRGLARPNILMFNDDGWDGARTSAQARRFQTWLDTLPGARVVVIEIGAGRAVPTVRLGCEELVRKWNGTLVRINPREPDVPLGHIRLPIGGLAALSTIDGAAQHPLSTMGS